MILWSLILPVFVQVLSVQPAHGCIQPETSAACKVTFCSHSSPSCYDLDLICRVRVFSCISMSHESGMHVHIYTCTIRWLMKLRCRVINLSLKSGRCNKKRRSMPSPSLKMTSPVLVAAAQWLLPEEEWLVTSSSEHRLFYHLVSITSSDYVKVEVTQWQEG